jgi:hypothetical protein
MNQYKHYFNCVDLLTLKYDMLRFYEQIALEVRKYIKEDDKAVICSFNALVYYVTTSGYFDDKQVREMLLDDIKKMQYVDLHKKFFINCILHYDGVLYKSLPTITDEMIVVFQQTYFDNGVQEGIAEGSGYSVGQLGNYLQVIICILSTAFDLIRIDLRIKGAMPDVGKAKRGRVTLANFMTE